jgi:hypothetical protein
LFESTHLEIDFDTGGILVMTQNGPTTRSMASIANRYWGYAVLGAWAGLVLSLGLLRFDPHGIDEPAARALLLAWSVAGKIASTVFVLGLPDLRTVLFAPLAIYWPGSIVAAKSFQLLIIAAMATLLYRWSRRDAGDETALLATGLLLFAPVTIAEADALGAGPYILLSFAAGAWLDGRYRDAGRPLGGWYFLQLSLIMFAASIHPAGLVYGLGLAWRWKTQPLDRKTQRHMLLGIAAALIIILIMRLGWPALSWLANPVTSIYQAILGRETASGALPWMIGGALLGVILLIAIRERRRLKDDFMRQMMMGGLVLGLASADHAWGMLAIAALLYLGTPFLLRFNKSAGGEGLIGQRGIVLGLLFMTLIVFTQADKAHRYAIAQNLLPPADDLIMRFGTEIEDTEKDQPFLTMSQWPGKTMLVLRRAVLPLPPPYPDAETLLAKIKGVKYLLFDPKDPANKSLAKNLAEATGAAETMMVEEGGVAIRLRTAPGSGERKEESGK